MMTDTSSITIEVDTEEPAQNEEERSIIQRDTTYVDVEKLWKSIFNSYDMDNDGKIQVGDFKALLELENNTSCLHPNVIEEIMERADWDKDHFITYDEFKSMMLAANCLDESPISKRLLRFAAFLVVPNNEQATTVRQYVERQYYLKTPRFIFLISLIQMAIYIYYYVKLKDLIVNGPIRYDSVFVFIPNRKKELWRYITYMFIHSDSLHIIFNVLYQLAFGIPLELIHNWWRVGLVYLAGGLSGSLAASIFNLNKNFAGASAGVYALIAAYLPNVIVHFKDLKYRWLRLAILITLVSIEGVAAQYNRFILKKEDDTSHAGHIGGTLAGLLVGFVILRNNRYNPREERLRWIIGAIYIGVTLFAILWDVLYNDYYPTQS